MADSSVTKEGSMSVIRSQCKDDAEYRQALRDDFAAAALSAVIAKYEALTKVGEHTVPAIPSAAAYLAYEYADALLAERAK